MRAALQQWRQRSSGHRVFILPSRYGLGYTLLILVMLVGAINYNNSLAYLLTFLLAGLGHVAMHHSYRNINRLRCHIAPAQPVFVGQPIALPLSLDNTAGHSLLQITIAYHDNPPKRSWLPMRQYSRYQPVQQLESIDAGQQRTLRVPIPARRRGWQRLGRLRLSSVYPLGLLNSWLFVDCDQQVLIYPKPAGSKPLPVAEHPQQGTQLQQQSGLDDFAGFKRYRQGDVPQHIAWKALARDEVLRSKQFSTPSGQQLMLGWQQLGDVQDVEMKLSQLCQWLLQAHAAGLSYGLQLPGQQIAIGTGDAHQQRCLRALALYDR